MRYVGFQIVPGTGLFKIYCKNFDIYSTVI